MPIRYRRKIYIKYPYLVTPPEFCTLYSGGKINKIPLLKVMENLDRLNMVKNQLGGDGFFDFVEDIRSMHRVGRIFFGSDLWIVSGINLS